MANDYWDGPTPMDVDCDNESPIDKPPVKKNIYRKRTIPKTLKINVWNHYPLNDYRCFNTYGVRDAIQPENAVFGRYPHNQDLRIF